MTRKEADRLTHQENVLMALGFTKEEAESLRRISMTLHRWHELECGTEAGCIERDEASGIPQWRYASDTGKYCGRPIPDREAGAQKRLAKILAARNARTVAVQAVCPNCDQWQHAGNGGDCLNACVARGFAPSRKTAAYVQTDPRGAALYILRPGDVPAGESADAYYTRGICVY